MDAWVRQALWHGDLVVPVVKFSETPPPAPATVTACFTAQRSTSICEYPQSPLTSVLYVLPHSSPADTMSRFAHHRSYRDGFGYTDVSQCTLGQALTTCLWHSSLTSRDARHALAPAPLVPYGSSDPPLQSRSDCGLGSPDLFLYKDTSSRAVRGH